MQLCETRLRETWVLQKLMDRLREEEEGRERDFAFETILHGIFVILCLAALLSRGWPGGLACV